MELQGLAAHAGLDQDDYMTTACSVWAYMAPWVFVADLSAVYQPAPHLYGPKNHRNMRILHPGCKAQEEGDSKNHHP